MKKSCLLFLLASSILLLGSARPERLRVVTEHLPPYQVTVGNTLQGGIIADDIIKLFKFISPSTPIEVMPWSSAYHLAASRPNTVIFSMARTPEREKHFIWIGKLTSVSTRLVTLKTSDIERVDNLTKLDGYSIGVKKNDLVAEYFLKSGFQFGRNLVEIVNPLSTLQLLERGRVNIVPADDFIIDFHCQKHGCSPTDFKTIYVFNNLTEDFYLAANKNSDPEIIEQITSEFKNYISVVKR